jgi:hypothetical protein
MPYRTAEVEIPEWKPREWGLARFLRDVWDDEGAYARWVAVLISATLSLVLFVVTLLVTGVFIPFSQTTEPDENWERVMRTQRRYQECVQRYGVWNVGETGQWCSYYTRSGR